MLGNQFYFFIYAADLSVKGSQKMHNAAAEMDIHRYAESYRKTADTCDIYSKHTENL